MWVKFSKLGMVSERGEFSSRAHPLFDRTRTIPSSRPAVWQSTAPAAAPAEPARSVPRFREGRLLTERARGLQRTGLSRGARLNGSGVRPHAAMPVLVFAQIIHVEVAVLLEPVFLGFDGERSNAYWSI